MYLPSTHSAITSDPARASSFLALNDVQAGLAGALPGKLRQAPNQWRPQR